MDCPMDFEGGREKKCILCVSLADVSVVNYLTDIIYLQIFKLIQY